MLYLHLLIGLISSKKYWRAAKKISGCLKRHSLKSRLQARDPDTQDLGTWGSRLGHGTLTPWTLELGSWDPETSN